MSAGPLQPLSPRVFRYAPVINDFESFTTNELGTTPNALTYIDQQMQEFFNSLVGQITLGASMDQDIAALDALLSEVSFADAASILEQLAGAASFGDIALSNLGEAINIPFLP
jgi:hypothetical protein